MWIIVSSREAGGAHQLLHYRVIRILRNLYTKLPVIYICTFQNCYRMNQMFVVMMTVIMKKERKNGCNCRCFYNLP